MKNFVSLTLLLLLTYTSVAQEHNHDGVNLLDKCHTTQMEQKLIDENPEWAPLIEAAIAAQEEFDRNFESSPLREGEEFTIPVVFHIVHDYGPENITQAQVQSCIDVMNEDFNALNESINDVHPEFQDIIGGMDIRFALATLDPDGNCTNGITRWVSEETVGAGENLKEIAPIWDRESYMNVWVARTLTGNTAGYTYRPGTVSGNWGAQIDGIVVRHDYVGSIGTSSEGHAHTMTHEVGHWLNLPHLWGNTNEPGVESNCDIDDGIDDTPLTVGWTSCNVNGTTCGSLDNVENYMEYSYCSKMFTQDQITRMESALTSDIASRSSLWQPENLAETGVDLDPVLCGIDFIASDRTVCVGEAIEFTDYSYGGILERQWTFEGGEPAISDSINQVVVYNTPGLYYMNLEVTDGVNTMQVLEENFIRVLDTAETALPYFEGFEELTEIDEEGSLWYTETTDSPDIDWEITSDAAYSGTQSAYVHGRQNDNGATEYLLSQTFDLSEVTEEVSLTFKYACAPRYSNSNDQLKIWISKDCGEFWSLRGTLDEEDLYTVSENVSGEFVPADQSEWAEYTVENIVSVFWNSSFRIRFEFISGIGNNIYIDDINLVDLSGPLSVSNIERLKDAVSVFPNPATDMLNIEMQGIETQENVEINLIDLSGRIVENVYGGTVAVGNNRFQMNVADLSKGVYFLEFRTSEGRFAEKVMIGN